MVIVVAVGVRVGMVGAKKEVRVVVTIMLVTINAGMANVV